MAGEEIVQIGAGDLENEFRRELDHHLGGERQRRYRRFLLAAFCEEHAGPNANRTRSRVMKSAFDHIEQYELTELGRQFVHYTTNEVVARIGTD